MLSLIIKHLFNFVYSDKDKLTNKQNKTAV